MSKNFIKLFNAHWKDSDYPLETEIRFYGLFLTSFQLFLFHFTLIKKPKKDTHVSHSECCCTGGGAWGKEMACVTCPEQFTPEYAKLCGATNQPEEEPVYTEPPTEESVTVENETDDNSIEGIFSKIECNLWKSTKNTKMAS